MTYIIASTDYMCDGPSMREFIGTFRQLLEELNGATDENRFTDDPISGMSNDELVECFDDANGDGQPYVTVWCVEERRQVLGIA